MVTVEKPFSLAKGETRCFVIEAERKADMCIGCHSAAQGGDFLFTNDQGR
jgi:hypothetical protein